MNPYQNIYGQGEVGEGTKLGAFVDIGGKVGKNCKIQSFVSIPYGVEIEDEVFIGPHVGFANDIYARVKGEWHPIKTLIKKGASIGMNATIGAGITIGENSFIGMGSVVIKDIPAGEVWVGNPAKFLREATIIE